MALSRFGIHCQLWIASIIEKWRIHLYAVMGSLKDQGFAAAYRDHAILSGSGQAYAAHAGHHNRCVLWNDKPWYRGSIRGRIVAGVYRRWVIGRLKPSAQNKYTNSSKYASEHLVIWLFIFMHFWNKAGIYCRGNRPKVRPRPNLENIDDGVEQQKKRFADEVAEILGEHSLSRLRLGPRLRF
jgi:hypothetical protein